MTPTRPVDDSSGGAAQLGVRYAQGYGRLWFQGTCMDKA